MAITIEQVWHHYDVRNVTYRQQDLVTWEVFHWITVGQAVRSEMLTQYTVTESAYRLPADITIQTAAGTESDPATIQVHGGVNTGDHVQIKGQFTQGSRILIFELSGDLTFGDQNQAASQIADLLRQQIGLRIELEQIPETDLVPSVIKVYPDTVAGADSVVLSELNYTPSTPVIPAPPTRTNPDGTLVN